MSQALQVFHPLTLLLDERQLRVLIDECTAWEAELYGPVTALLDVSAARGEPGRWRASFSMLRYKAGQALVGGSRRDGRFRLAVSPNQAERVHTALTWRIATHTSDREPDAAVTVWRTLADAMRDGAARPFGAQIECAPAVATASAPPENSVRTPEVPVDPRQADFFAGASHA